MLDTASDDTALPGVPTLGKKLPGLLPPLPAMAVCWNDNWPLVEPLTALEIIESAPAPPVPPTPLEPPLPPVWKATTDTGPPPEEQPNADAVAGPPWPPKPPVASARAPTCELPALVAVAVATAGPPIPVSVLLATPTPL